MIMDAKNEAWSIPAKEIENFFQSVEKGMVVLFQYQCNIAL